jgi:hypothetical protein
MRRAGSGKHGKNRRDGLLYPVCWIFEIGGGITNFKIAAESILTFICILMITSAFAAANSDTNNNPSSIPDMDGGGEPQIFSGTIIIIDGGGEPQIHSGTIYVYDGGGEPQALLDGGGEPQFYPGPVTIIDGGGEPQFYPGPIFVVDGGGEPQSNTDGGGEPQ